MYYTYIFYSLLFLVSFAVAEQGLLNENVYVKQFTSGIVFITMLAISLIQSLKQNKTILHITWGDVLIVGVLLVYLCFYWGTYNNLDFTLPFIYFLFYVFIRVYSSGNYKHISILYLIIPIIVLSHILICALQFVHIIPAFHSYFPVGSTFGNPDVLGAYLAVLFPFCYVHSGQKIFKYTVLLLGVILLLLLQARTALVATVITGILYLLLSGKITGKQLIKWLLFPFIACLVLLIWWHPASVLGRLFIWFTASKMIVEKPMGWGLYAFEKHYPEFQSDYITSHRIPDLFNPDLVHSPYNEFLNAGVTLGFAGLLLFILFALFIIIAAYRARTPFLFPICIFLIISISYHPFKITPLVIILIAFIALILNFCRIKPILTINLRQKTIVLIPIMIIAILLIGSSWVNYNRWQTAVENTQKEEYWKMANTQFEEIYPMMKGNERILFLQRIGEHQEAYREAIELYNKPVKSSYYVDPFIIKTRMKTIIQIYEDEQIK